MSALGVRLLGYGSYGILSAMAFLGFLYPHAHRVLLIVGGLVGIAATTVVVVGLNKLTPTYFFPYEGWLLYGMYSLALSAVAFGAFGTPWAMLGVLFAAVVIVVLIVNADKLGGDYPDRPNYHGY